MTEHTSKDCPTCRMDLEVLGRAIIFMPTKEHLNPTDIMTIDNNREPEGRCAEHVGLIHRQTDSCRRFMSLAFAKDLGIEDG